MATSPEGWVKKAVKELLEYWDVYYHMPVQNGMGKPSLDFICCVQGKFLAVETKAPGKSMTPRQRQTANEIEHARGEVLSVSSWAGLMRLHYYLVSSYGGGRSDSIPAIEEARWRRWLANAGAKDAHQHAT